MSGSFTDRSDTQTQKKVLEFKSISKEFNGAYALREVSFSLYQGEVLSLMGENGAGKSTLMKILCGVWPRGSYQGEFWVSSPQCDELVLAQFRDTRDAHATGIAMIHQELSVFDELTVAEHLELGHLKSWIDWDALFHRVQLFLDSLGFGLQAEARVGDLSVGGKQLVEIARALYQKAHILIFDEPTSALSEQEVLRLYQIIDQLRVQGKSILYITHRMDEVFRLSDRMLVLRDGQGVGMLHAYEQGVALRREELEPELIHRMVGRPIEDIYPQRNTLMGETLLEVRGLSLTTQSGKSLVRDLSFKLHRGEVIGLAGLLGAGRSETFEALFGVLNGEGPRGKGYRLSGEVLMQRERVTQYTPRDAIASKMAYVSEDRKGSGLIIHQSIRSNMVLPALVAGCEGFTQGQRLISWIRSDQESAGAQSWAKELRIKAQHLDQPVGELSGGNQQKVVLAKWLMTSPEILFLDEPTRGIDIGAKVEIYQWIQKLAAQGMGIIVASSEMPELIGLCHRILVLREGAISGEFLSENVTQEEIMRAASL